MADTGKNIIIGVFVLAAIVILVWLVLFIQPSPGDESQNLHIRFTNIEKIQVGTRVTFAGEPVGRVAKIINHFNGTSNPREESGQMYFFEVVLAVDSGVYVYDTDEITIRMTGLFGERNVAIIPRRPPDGIIPIRATSETILYAKSQDAMDQAFGEFVNVAGQMGTTFEKLSDLIDANADDLNHAIATFDQSMEDLGDTFRAVNESEVISSVALAFEGIGAVMDIIETDLRTLEEKGAWENAGVMIANLTRASSNIEEITGDLAAGRGTLGRLLSNDDLYLELQALLAKASTAMNDINHYGILFHQNRRWQRERTQRANELAALKSPQAFRCFFDHEIDAISTALARVSILLEKAECGGRKQRIMSDPCFSKEFATLLRRVQALEEELEHYNEALVDCQPCRY